MNGALAAFDVELPEMVRARMPSMPAKMLFDFAVYLTVAVRPILMLAESVTVMLSLETSAPLSDAACALKVLVAICFARSEERRVGKACVSKCRSRWSPDH